MRITLAIKTLFRSPLKTLLTFFLLFAASFMMVYNLADYSMTGREFARSMANYKGIVSVERDREIKSYQQGAPFFLLSDPTNEANYDNYFPYEKFHMPSFTEDELQTITAMPHITSPSKRYMTAGISSQYQRTDVQGTYNLDTFFNYTGRFVIEATIDSVEPTYSGLRNPGLADGSTDGYVLTVSNVEHLAGREDWVFKPEHSVVPEGTYKIVAVTPTEKYYETANVVLGTSTEGRLLTDYRNNHVSTEMLEGIVPGERYVIAGRIDGRGEWTGEPVEYESESEERLIGHPLDRQIGDDTLYGWWPYIYSLEGKPENYLETEEFAPLRELIEITNNDLHTFDVVYTDDMSAIRRVTENRMLLSEGRLLTAEDSEKASPVCVVSDTMLQELGLEIGDSISLRLGDRLMEQYAPLGAVASTRGRYAENFTEEQEFEIVGSYVELNINKMLDVDLCWAYSDNTVFVPLSFLPVSGETLAEHEFKPSEVSFIIGDAQNIRSFYEEQLPVLEGMGFQVHFSDGGWMNIEQHLRRSEILTVSKLIAFAAASLLAILLTVYLFILRKKKEFAIMWALGTTRAKARRSLLIPLMVLAAAAIIPGGVLAALYAQSQAEDILSDFITIGLSVDTSVQLSAIAFGVLAELLFLLLAAFTGLIHIGRKPPLALLQAGGGRRGKRKYRAEVLDAAPVVGFSHIQAAPLPERGGYSALRHVTAYVRRHILRSRLKSALSIALALILCFAMGQLTAMRASYAELYQNIEVHGRIVNGMPLSDAQRIEKSEYVSDTYYEYYYHGEANRVGEVNEVACGFMMSNDPERAIGYDIEYMEGYDHEVMRTAEDRVCIVSDSVLEELGLTLGDKIDLNQLLFIQTHLAYSDPADENAYEKAHEAYINRSVECTIVGRIVDSAQALAYIPISSRIYYMSLMPAINLDLVEYTLSDYHQAADFMGYAQNALNDVNSITKPIFLMDTSEADNIYMIYRLIETLYPIALAAAVMIGGVLPGLIILQNAAEASILRVLGTTKKRARMMLLLEQLFLCLSGILLALIFLLGVNGGAVFSVAKALAFYCALHFAGGILGTVIASIQVTKRDVLELLQVKE